MKNLRTQLALKIAPWLKPGEPVAREWSVEPPYPTPDEIDAEVTRAIEDVRAQLQRQREGQTLASEVTWKGSWAKLPASWADRATR